MYKASEKECGQALLKEFWPFVWFSVGFLLARLLVLWERLVGWPPKRSGGNVECCILKHFTAQHLNSSISFLLGLHAPRALNHKS